MNKSVFFTFLFTFLFACQICGQTKSEAFSISCNLTGFEEGAIFSLVNLDQKQEVYTSTLKKQKIYFEGKISEPATFRLFPKDEKDASIYLNFWVENTAISLVADKNNFSNPIIKGSILNEIDRAVSGKYQNLQNERDGLMRKLIESADGTKQSEILANVKEIDKKVLETRLHTIETFKPSLITIKELFFLRNDLSEVELKKLFLKFPNSLKSTKYGKVISQYLANGEVKIGTKAANIGGKDFSGKIVNLSDFKGKIVLLDFWAAWCSPCRKSNKELAEIYRKYNSKGFEIVSFYIDTDSKIWQSASKEDGIFWSNISDLQGFYSKEAASFKVRSLPRAFLIDQNGEIVQIFSGYNTEAKSVLEDKIQELIK
ncbi:MAG TPA: TlpA disulfide reductase family protein [Pyrinomonadaceae bacterium]|nr:TlpA disulfide reductase family protein [Pyrinomonadaceae bacterium]